MVRLKIEVILLELLLGLPGGGAVVVLEVHRGLAVGVLALHPCARGGTAPVAADNSYRHAEPIGKLLCEVVAHCAPVLRALLVGEIVPDHLLLALEEAVVRDGLLHRVVETDVGGIVVFKAVLSGGAVAELQLHVALTSREPHRAYRHVCERAALGAVGDRQLHAVLRGLRREHYQPSPVVDDRAVGRRLHAGNAYGYLCAVSACAEYAYGLLELEHHVVAEYLRCLEIRHFMFVLSG